MNPALKAKILNIWHYTGMAVAAIGAAAVELQTSLPTGLVDPKISGLIAAVGAASVLVTGIMQKISNDKFIQAVINDPASPTPQGLMLPAPQTAPEPTPGTGKPQ